MSAQPLVSALMVTRNRMRLARRSLDCLAAQSWPALELVVVDDGDEDYAPLLERYKRRMQVRYLRLRPQPEQRLGALRNIALDNARGEFCAQWDDDEWFHPERLAVQVGFLASHDVDAVELRYFLMHLNEPGFVERPYRVDSRDGMPGSIVHRRSAERYPNLARSEDLAFERAFRRRGRLGCLEAGSSHLIVRCHHGANTWQRGHFENRLRRSLRQRLDYLVARWVRRDPWSQTAFRLDAEEAATAERFLRESRALGLLCQEPPR